jgi:thiol-disulfide isomerase/thioredoxin
MKTSIYFILFYLISVGGFTALKASQEKRTRYLSENYTVSGTIIGASDGWIFLAHGESLRREMRVDSTRILDGKFRFTGTTDRVQPFLLGLPMRDKSGKEHSSSKFYQGPMLLSAGNLIVAGKYGEPYKAHGTKSQDEFNSFNAKLKLVDDQLKNIREKVYKLRKSESGAKADLQAKYNSILPQRVETAKNHIAIFNDSEVSAYIIKSMFLTADRSTLQSLYVGLTSNVQNSKSGQELKSLITSAGVTDEGAYAPQFALNDINGNLVTLDTFKGQFVLIDFWASWCGPCREENPNLIRLYESYGKKGLKIIGVSLDSSMENWVKAINEDKLPWLQLGDQKATDSKVAKDYNIKAIPMNFLLDKRGRIIGRNLKGPALEAKIKSLL